jgi:hypothetical protein
MEWYEYVFELIDLRSFSNLWFWISLAVFWSTTSHRILGVPYDMVTRARRRGGQAQTDLEDMVRINVNRMLYIGRVSGLWILGMACFVITILGLLGFRYNIEFAQALLLLMFPMSIVRLLGLSVAKQIEAGHNQGDDLHRALNRHRMVTQIIAMFSIFVTAMWGMYQNMNLGSLGN